MNIVTSDVAKSQRCPFAAIRKGETVMRLPCDGDRCMAWRDVWEWRLVDGKPTHYETWASERREAKDYKTLESSLSDAPNEDDLHGLWEETGSPLGYCGLAGDPFGAPLMRLEVPGD